VTSAELMLDTGYTLAHNNGPIFNKQVLYHPHDTTELKKILDVQRAGMIPQMVHSGASKFVSLAHRKFHEKALALLGEEFGGPVNWFTVENLGAVQSYTAEKAAMADPEHLYVLPGLQLKKVKRGKA